MVGVDRLPLPDGRYVVIEVNGAVDFTPDYSFGAEDVFEAVAGQLLSVPVQFADASQDLLAHS